MQCTLLVNECQRQPSGRLDCMQVVEQKTAIFHRFHCQVFRDGIYIASLKLQTHNRLPAQSQNTPAVCMIMIMHSYSNVKVNVNYALSCRSTSLHLARPVNFEQVQITLQTFRLRAIRHHSIAGIEEFRRLRALYYFESIYLKVPSPTRHSLTLSVRAVVTG